MARNEDGFPPKVEKLFFVVVGVPEGFVFDKWWGAREFLKMVVPGAPEEIRFGMLAVAEPAACGIASISGSEDEVLSAREFSDSMHMLDAAALLGLQKRELYWYGTNGSPKSSE